MSRSLTPRLAASQSFNEDELKVLEHLVQVALRGGGLHQMSASPALQNLARKTAAMRAAIERNRARRTAP